MKSKHTGWIVALLFLPIVALGSKPEPKTDLKVKFDHSFYDLEFSRDLFKYNEATRAYGIKIKDCNRRKRNETAYKTLLDENSHQLPRQETKSTLNL